MDEQAQLDALVELAEGLGIPIRRVPAAGESAEHPGGAMVRLKGKEVIFLDPTAVLADQVAMMAQCLRGRKEIEDRFLPPELRQLIDEVK